MRDDCCCNWEPFTLRCGPCTNQHHAKCDELIPGRRRSDYPGYPPTAADVGAVFAIVVILSVFAIMAIMIMVFV